MNEPWIEIDQYRDEEERAGPGFAEYVWQALFAYQVGIRPHNDWVKLKWGFNASALFDETLERQRLFLESQYAINNEIRLEKPDHRTLAIRYINRPGEGLMLTIIGKIHGQTKAKAIENAAAFYRELKSTFPYDYTLAPALSRDEFVHISGWDILDEGGGPVHLAQIKRVEMPTLQNRRSPFLQGFWQSSPRAHEQIWRSLAASPSPLLMNISIRSTILYEREQEKLLSIAKEISEIEDELLDQKNHAAKKQWSDTYLERRLSPWKKFFYLQVHLVSPRDIDDNLFRIVGTSITLGNDKQPSLGYQAISPRKGEELPWRKKLKNLDVILPGSFLPVPRMAEVADLEEVVAVVRLPYSPPENGFPDMNFAAPRND